MGLTVTARGEKIGIEGKEESVKKATTIISELVKLSDSGKQVNEEDVLYAIHCVQIKKTEPDEPNNFQLACRESIPLLGKKGPITPKSSAQNLYIDHIRNHDIVVGIGPAGTGKTYLATAMAIAAYQRKEVKRIILARPADEAGERLGFLPGDLGEKLNPYLRPLYDALYDMMSSEQTERLLERGDIEIAPLAFMRGRTLKEAFVILDEAQNTTSEQMKMLLTRLGPKSKAVITGDITQIDLPLGQVSGLVEIQQILQNVSGIVFSYFTEKDVVRHPLVQKIIKAYEKHNKNSQANS